MCRTGYAVNHLMIVWFPKLYLNRALACNVFTLYFR